MIVCTDGPTDLDGHPGRRAEDRAGTCLAFRCDATSSSSRPILPLSRAHLTIALEGNSIYSLTTTTGQRKGEPAHAIPAAKPFPLPYRDDFESYRPGESPRYFSDQKGTFEVWDEPGHGKCLKQIVPQQGIMWEYMQERRQALHGHRRSEMVRLRAGRRRAYRRGRRRTGRPLRRPGTSCPTAGSWPRTEPGSSTTRRRSWPRARSRTSMPRLACHEDRVPRRPRSVAPSTGGCWPT